MTRLPNAASKVVDLSLRQVSIEKLCKFPFVPIGEWEIRVVHPLGVVLSFLHPFKRVRVI